MRDRKIISCKYINVKGVNKIYNLIDIIINFVDHWQICIKLGTQTHTQDYIVCIYVMYKEYRSLGKFGMKKFSSEA